MEKLYITTATETHDRYHRSPVIVHRSNGYYFAEFENMEQLQFFADTLGFTFHLVESRPAKWNPEATWHRYEVSHELADPYCGGFWKREDVPKDAKPIKALSNGSIVTCYFINDGAAITFYRPNPNAKEVYKPLPLEQHINHRRIYGCY